MRALCSTETSFKDRSRLVNLSVTQSVSLLKGKVQCHHFCFNSLKNHCVYNVCAYRYRYISVGTHVPWHMYRGQRTTLGIGSCLSFCFRQSLLFTTGHARLAGSTIFHGSVFISHSTVGTTTTLSHTGCEISTQVLRLVQPILYRRAIFPVPKLKLVSPYLDRMVKKNTMHCFSNGFHPSEGEGQVRKTSTYSDSW